MCSIKTLSIFADRPVVPLYQHHVISSNWASVKCCFRERGAERVGSDFPPACLWSVFVSWFEAAPPTCCDRKGINSARRQNLKKSLQRKMMLKTIKCVMHFQSHCSQLNSDILQDSQHSAEYFWSRSIVILNTVNVRYTYC